LIGLVALIGLWLSTGCAGSPTATPEPQIVKQLPPGSMLKGIPLGNDGLKVGDYTVWLASAAQPRPGNVMLDAVVLGKDDQPVTNAAVSFDISMTNMNHGDNVGQATNVGGGHYTGPVHFTMAGPWRVIVMVNQAGRQVASVQFNF
jgi:hypothetical protein